VRSGSRGVAVEALSCHCRLESRGRRGVRRLCSSGPNYSDLYFPSVSLSSVSFAAGVLVCVYNGGVDSRPASVLTGRS
jgi:hypothetical protein